MFEKEEKVRDREWYICKYNIYLYVIYRREKEWVREMEKRKYEGENKRGIERERESVW